MGELVTIKPTNVDAYRASTEAATLCKEIVQATASNIQGRKYVSVEGWQAIARAHGCAAGARDVERVDGGVRAIGEIRDILTGQLIASAEGFVGEDEPTWYGGPSRGKTLPKRADYAIRAMAQTRAMSRACRSAFAHVVVMMNAGLQTTPAEEVPQEGFDPQTGEITHAPPPGIHKIKERMRQFMLDGAAATTLEDFDALGAQNKGDIETLKDNNHAWWTGDGEDHEGLKAFIKRRREELAGPSLQFTMLASLVAESTTSDDLKRILTEHDSAIGLLDGEESNTFEELYEAKLEALKNPTPLVAEAFGG